MCDPSSKVSDSSRLKGLRNTLLLDTPAEQCFDRVSRLASRLLEAPVALVSLVDADRQFFKSCVGLPEPWATDRQTPLSHSFCQHVVNANELFVVKDSREDERVRGNMAIADLNVIAYIGAPLTTFDGQTIGALCVIDSEPRDWTSEQETLLLDLASFVMVEIERRRTTLAELAAKTEVRNANERSNEIFRLLVEGVKDYAILMLDPNGNVQTWNGGALCVKGYTPAEIIGAHFSIFYPSEDIETGKPQLALKSAAELGQFCEDGWRVRKDGTRFFANVTITALKNGDGSLRGFAKITKDLTERVTAESALRAAEVQMRCNEERAHVDLQRRFLADSMPQIVWTSKPDGSLDYYNERWHTYTGMTFEQTKDWGWKAVMHPDDLQHCINTWTHSFTTGVPYEIEYRLRRASDGAYRWHLGRALPRLDASGAIIEWVGTCTDMHDQWMIASDLEESRNDLETRVAERTAQLHQEKRFVEAILDNVSDGIVACDAAGNITLMNQATRELHGLPEESTSPEDWASKFKLFMADGVTSMQQKDVPLYRALQGEIVSDVELVIQPQNGKTRRLVASGRALIDCDGRKFGAVVGIHDITERVDTEAALREAYASLSVSEQRFQTFMDNSPFVAWVKDETGTITYANRRYGAELPSFHNNLIGKNDTELFPPEVAKRVRDEDLKVLAGETYAGHHDVVRFDGTTRSWQIAKFPMTDPDGARFVAGFGVDVTEQRRAADELQSAYTSLAEAHAARKQIEDRFQAFMDNSPAVCFIKDDQSRLLYMNRRFESDFNTTSAQLLGKTDAEFLPPDVARQIMANDRFILDSEIASELIEHAPLPDGQMRHWMSFKFPLKAANGEKLLGGMAFDVTARIAAEAELARQKEFIETVLENVSDGIIACDAAGQITYLNPEIRQMLGISNLQEERSADWATETLPLYDPVTDHRLSWSERPLGRALSGETVNGIELVIKPSHGGQCNIVISARALTDPDGKITGAVAAWHDITDLRRSQQDLLNARDSAAAANQAKSEFLANMSHEIRTPMTAILGFTDLLTMPKLSEDARASHVQTIRRNGEHLLSIINDILDLSKIEAGKLTIERIHCSPRQVVAEVESLMRVRAIEKKISFQVDYVGRIPEAICSDPTRLRQILLNLVSNAVKFTRSGGVRVTVSVLGNDAEPRIQFEIADTGIGLTQDQQDNLFRPFAQADNSTTRRFGGTGLGLAICKRMAAALGGDILLTSEPGKGSTFTLIIDGTEVPILDSMTDAGDSQANNPLNSLALTEPMHGRILLAEDGVDNQRLVTFYLEQAGLSVEWACDGNIAVKMVQDAAAASTQYDLVLMDMQMPELDGYGATRKLRQLGFGELPIVAFTAHAFAEERERCKQCGCDDYVTKPINPSSLLQTLRTNLSGRSSAPTVETSVPVDQTGGPASELSATATNSCPEDDHTIKQMVHECIEHLPKQVDQLVAALGSSELAELNRAVHQLKGFGGLHGLPEPSHGACETEAAITQSDPLEQTLNEVNSLIDLIRKLAGHEREKENGQIATALAWQAGGESGWPKDKEIIPQSST